MSITVATNFIRIGSCVDSKVFSYSIQVPYLFGDNRGVVLAPFNAGFVGLKQHLDSCELQIKESYISNFKSPF